MASSIAPAAGPLTPVPRSPSITRVARCEPGGASRENGQPQAVSIRRFSAASPSSAAGSAVSGTVAFFSLATTNNELTEFMVNATSSISAQTLVPESELLIGSKVTPASFASTVQSDYVSQLASR